MGLDVLDLRVLATSSDDPNEKENAATGETLLLFMAISYVTPPFALMPVVLKILKKGRHWVLVVSRSGAMLASRNALIPYSVSGSFTQQRGMYKRIRGLTSKPHCH